MDFSFLLEPFYVGLLFQGLLTTIVLAIVAVFLGTVVAVFVALIRMSKFKVLRFLFGAYVEVLRGTPVVVQLIIFYALFHVRVLLVGGMDLSPFIPGMFTLFVNSSAYMAEVIRAGINSIDKGQWEASRSLGMTHQMTFWKIIFPQAVRNILPALGNEFVTLIKETSVLMYSGVAELTYQATMIKSQTYGFMESYLVAAALYFALTYPTSLLMKRLERRLAKAYA
ncbi:MAG: amino acid ABC transporter permease [Candidatus Izemoplasmatales bacterium]